MSILQLYKKTINRNCCEFLKCGCSIFVWDSCGTQRQEEFALPTISFSWVWMKCLQLREEQDYKGWSITSKTWHWRKSSLAVRHRHKAPPALPDLFFFSILSKCLMLSSYIIPEIAFWLIDVFSTSCFPYSFSCLSW